MRLGQILQGYKKVRAWQVDGALARQERHGGRLGTNLLEAGAVGIDEITTALSAQHQVPGALVRHLKQIDKSLVNRLPPAVALKCEAFPLATPPGNPGTIICVMRDPFAGSIIRELEQNLGCKVVAAALAEFAVYRYLRKLYGLEIPARFRPKPKDQSAAAAAASRSTLSGVGVSEQDLRSVKTTMPAVGVPPKKERAVSEPFAPTGGDSGFQLTTLDAEGVSRDESIYQSSGTIKLSTPLSLSQSSRAVIDVDTCLARMEHAQSRDSVLGSLLAYAQGRFAHAVVFVVRGDVLLGHAAIGVSMEVARSLVIPKSATELLASAWGDSAMASPALLAPSSDVDQRFCRAIHAAPGSQYMVFPLRVAKRIVAVVFGDQTPGQTIDAKTCGNMTTLATSASTQLIRIIRESKGA